MAIWSSAPGESLGAPGRRPDGVAASTRGESRAAPADAPVGVLRARPLRRRPSCASAGSHADAEPAPSDTEAGVWPASAPPVAPPGVWLSPMGLSATLSANCSGRAGPEPSSASWRRTAAAAAKIGHVDGVTSVAAGRGGAADRSSAGGRRS